VWVLFERKNGERATNPWKKNPPHGNQLMSIWGSNRRTNGWGGVSGRGVSLPGERLVKSLAHHRVSKGLIKRKGKS